MSALLVGRVKASDTALRSALDGIMVTHNNITVSAIRVVIKTKV